MRRPKVITRCVADHYAAPNERIIEFNSSHGGGLISFRECDGLLIVDVYRTDPKVFVNAGVGRKRTSKALAKTE